MKNARSSFSPEELNFSASSSRELLNVLSLANKRLASCSGPAGTKCAESSLMSHVLATLAESPLLRYPLNLEHSDKPDFSLKLDDRLVGVECVTSVPQDWLEIQALRDRSGNGDPIAIPRLSSPTRNLSLSEKREIANGSGPAYPIMGNAIELDWARGVAHCVAIKAKKLQDGTYGSAPENWLAVHDRWPGASHYESDLDEAAQIAWPLLGFRQPKKTFDIVFVKSVSWLVVFTPAGYRIERLQKPAAG